MDYGETFQQAAVRECIEEAGVRVGLVGILRIEHGVHDGYGLQTAMCCAVL